MESRGYKLLDEEAQRRAARPGMPPGGRGPDLVHCPPVMEVWCFKRIPVEGNFGQTYDSVNQSIHGLSGEFSAHIDIKVGG